MPEIVVRAGVLVLVVMLLWLVAWSGRRFVEIQRRRALAAAPLVTSTGSDEVDVHSNPSPVRILAFSSADCHQCHQLQTPALQRVMEARGRDVSVIEVDAPSSPELTQRYRVLTLPTTVVLDVTGRAHAVNYGFANSQQLLEQVDEVLATIAQSTS
jgi:thioredoxin-like negative regulator of GroEL